MTDLSPTALHAMSTDIPTDEQLWQAWELPEYEALSKQDTINQLRAVLARWGRPAINPVPVVERLPGAQGPTDEELDAIWFAARWGRPAVEPTDG